MQRRFFCHGCQREWFSQANIGGAGLIVWDGETCICGSAQIEEIAFAYSPSQLDIPRDAFGRPTVSAMVKQPAKVLEFATPPPMTLQEDEATAYIYQFI